MILNNKTYIRHTNKPEWGLGKVTQVLNPQKFSAFFENKGHKILIYSPNYIQIESEIESHPLLDNIDLANAKAKMSSEHVTLERMVAGFLKIFPQGFNDKKYYENERGYKLKASKKLNFELSRENFAKLLDDKNFSEITRLCRLIAGQTNLIYPNEMMGLKEALESPAHQELFSKSLFNLLYGEQSLKSRFMDFAGVLSRIKADKWTIQTYFLYLFDPEQYLFMKPVITQKAAKICNFELHYDAKLNWRTYNSLQNFGIYFKTELCKFGEHLTPKDMIDVQSFFWAIANKDAYGKD